MELGGNVHARDANGYTLLHWAAGGGHKETVRMLVEEMGVGVDAHGPARYTTLHVAALEGHTETANTGEPVF